MSRVLIAWELGGNLGHLARLVPFARRLRACGHQVLLVIRDLRAGATLCAPHGLPYVQSPLPAQPGNRHFLPASYAEILLCEGFADIMDLRGRVDAWLGLYRLWSPDAVVIDHAPTALFTARLASIPALSISSGFEIPPALSPLPCIRPWQAIPRNRLAVSEARVVANLNHVSRTHGGTNLEHLARLFDLGRTCFITFPELDHYGHRPDGTYIGPVFGEIGGAKTDWRDGSERRILAYLRANVPGVQSLLRVLRDSGHEVICFMPDMPKSWRAELASPALRLFNHVFDMARLLPATSLVVSYGGSGMINGALLAGVPLLLNPRNVEQYLSAQRVAALGAGWVMEHRRQEADYAHALEALLNETSYVGHARAFAERHGAHTAGAALDHLVNAIHALLAPASAGPPPPAAVSREVAAHTPLSVILPVKNAARTLEKAVFSVLGQTIARLELILVEDESEDDTHQLARAFARQDSRVLHVKGGNRGVYDAMNLGIRQATGRWLYFLGADDLLCAADVLEKALGMAHRAQLDVAYGQVILGDSGKPYDGPFDLAKLLRRNICHQALLYRRDLFQRLGAFNTDYRVYADWEFNLRWMATPGIRHAYLDIAIARFAQTGLSSRMTDAAWRDGRFDLVAHLLAKDPAHAALLRGLLEQRCREARGEEGRLYETEQRFASCRFQQFAKCGAGGQ